LCLNLLSGKRSYGAQCSSGDLRQSVQNQSRDDDDKGDETPAGGSRLKPLADPEIK
jgi:hypothetical protein